MSIIKDIYEIPMSKTITWIIVGIVSTVPANLIYYYFEPQLYLSIDLIKMLILTCGTGLIYFILNFIAALILTIIELNRENIINATRDNLLYASLSITLIVLIVTLVMACYWIKPGVDLKYFMKYLGTLQACINISFIAVALGTKIFYNKRAKRNIDN